MSENGKYIGVDIGDIDDMTSNDFVGSDTPTTHCQCQNCDNCKPCDDED